MMQKKLISILLVASLALAFVPYAGALSYDPGLELQSQYVCLASLDSDQILFEKDADARIHPASTTKIMSAAMALTLCDDLDVMVTAPDDLWDEFSSISGISTASPQIEPGETMSMYDLIHCMLLVSANEAASVVASYFGREEFLAKMNEKAAELGCSDTHFNNPSGLFTDNHYTTAADMYLIAKWAVGVPGFLEIASKARYTVPATNMNDERLLATTVLLQDPSSVYYTSYVRGVKTGTLPEAGRCLVTTAEKNGMTLLLVDMGAPYESISCDYWSDGVSTFTETRVLYDWAFANLELKNVINEDTPISGVTLKHAASRDELVVYGEGEVNVVLDKNRERDPEITYELSLPDEVIAPVAVGDEIGTARVLADGEYIGEIALISRENIEESRFAAIMDTLTEVMHSKTVQIILGVLIIAVAFYLYYIIVVVALSRRRKRKKQAAARRAAQQRKSSGGVQGQGDGFTYRSPSGRGDRR